MCVARAKSPVMPPGDSPQDAPAVERESRQQIENSENRIDLPEPAGRRTHHLVPVKEMRYQPEAARQEKTRDRPGNGDAEFLSCVRGVPADPCQTAEHEQGDRLDRYAIVQRDQTVTELVRDH